MDPSRSKVYTRLEVPSSCTLAGDTAKLILPVSSSAIVPVTAAGVPRIV